jgi:hypothetical protein
VKISLVSSVLALFLCQSLNLNERQSHCIK